MGSCDSKIQKDLSVLTRQTSGFKCVVCPLSRRIFSIHPVKWYQLRAFYLNKIHVRKPSSQLWRNSDRLNWYWQSTWDGDKLDSIELNWMTTLATDKRTLKLLSWAHYLINTEWSSGLRWCTWCASWCQTEWFASLFLIRISLFHPHIGKQKTYGSRWDELSLCMTFVVFVMFDCVFAVPRPAFCWSEWWKSFSLIIASRIVTICIQPNTRPETVPCLLHWAFACCSSRGVRSELYYTQRRWNSSLR